MNNVWQRLRSLRFQFFVCSAFTLEYCKQSTGYFHLNQIEVLEARPVQLNANICVVPKSRKFMLLIRNIGITDYLLKTLMINYLR